MKRKLKALAAVLLVLVMLGSAMPMQLAAEAMTPTPVMQHRTGTTTMIIKNGCVL